MSSFDESKHLRGHRTNPGRFREKAQSEPEATLGTAPADQHDLQDPVARFDAAAAAAFEFWKTAPGHPGALTAGPMRDGRSGIVALALRSSDRTIMNMALTKDGELIRPTGQNPRSRIALGLAKSLQAMPDEIRREYVEAWENLHHAADAGEVSKEERNAALFRGRGDRYRPAES